MTSLDLRLRSYKELSPEQRLQVFRFTQGFQNPGFSDPQAQEKAYLGPAFEAGATQLSVWAGDRVVGGIGVVIKEVPIKGEAYLTNFFVEADRRDVFEILLDSALAKIPTENLRAIELGLLPQAQELLLWSMAHGFKEAFSLLEYRYEVPKETPLASMDEAFEPLSSENQETFRQLANRAFRESPNGATMTEEDVEQVLKELQHPDFVALYHREGEPVGYYQLSLDPHGVGWIEAIGVDPAHHGRGIGRVVLNRGIEVLSEKVSTIKLKVASSNPAALRLYEKRGFILEKVASVWLQIDGAPSP